MEGLNINIKKVKSSQQSLKLEVFTLLFLILIGLLLLPILFLIYLLSEIYNLLLRLKKKQDDMPSTFLKRNSAELDIKYEYLKPEDVPGNLLSIYEEIGIMVFKTNPYMKFFDGYFTSFKVEREDGIFLQKVILDSNNEEIKSAPLFFFSYKEMKIKEIVDLYGFEIETKGNPDDFLICAYSNDQNFEIRLSK